MAQASTQQFLEVDAIKEGTLVLKDRSVRGVMMVSSQNFALKSEDEQEATIFQFQSFLNSLDFSVQMIVRSRKLNITGYLEYLEGLEKQQTNELLKTQTADYRAFIEKLIEGSSIMAKQFFVVVPFYLSDVVSNGRGGVLGAQLRGGRLSDDTFKRMKNQLWQRMEFVALGLRRAGLQVFSLSDEELIELFWSWHHPKEAEVGYYPEIPPEILT